MRACDDNKSGKEIMLDEFIGIQACSLKEGKKQKEL